MDRRRFLQATASLPLAVSPVFAQARGHVVVVGGGFGGATAAKYLRTYAPALKVTLVEPGDVFYSCPLSCRVLIGAMGIRELSQSYESFAKRHGVSWVRDLVRSIDAGQRQLLTASGQRISYDRVIVAPGVDYDYSGLAGMESAAAQVRMPHAWKAGEATVTLRQRLHDLRDGAVFAIHVPKAPFKATAAPYERACVAATLFRERGIKGKVLVFDANAEIANGKDLFSTAFKTRYADLIEYVPNATIKTVYASEDTIEFEGKGRVRASLWNVIPPQRAAAIARDAGLANVGERWCSVDFTSYESTVMRGVHLVGDAIAGSPGMPKSGHLANQEAKVCALAIARQLAGAAPVERPVLVSAAYSFVSRRDAAHAARVFRYDTTKRIMAPDATAGGNSAANELEGIYAMGWLSNVLGDTFD